MVNDKLAFFHFQFYKTGYCKKWLQTEECCSLYKSNTKIFKATSSEHL